MVYKHRVPEVQNYDSALTCIQYRVPKGRRKRRICLSTDILSLTGQF